jgi:hypothetical protein
MLKLTSALLLLIGVATFAKAQDDRQKIPAKLACGSWSGDPDKNRPFQDEIIFNISDRTLYGERDLRRGGGKEIYQGLIAPSEQF